VARYYFKLMAYKDEYEVARLYTSGEFERRIKQTFEDGGSLRFHLAPPLLAKRDADGHLVKREYGPWVLSAFRLLAKLRRLRGTALDIFGRTEERRMERQLIEDYRKTIEELLAGLKSERLPLATEIASLPEQIRGFGHVKESHVAKVRARWQALQARWREGLAHKA
ncbi:MAG TPA: DUF6537 domain-containing protein, partial [Arenimonas sp.]|nr:DUF6537 domain-containing protein [Arenimonas sp.]